MKNLASLTALFALPVFLSEPAHSASPDESSAQLSGAAGGTALRIAGTLNFLGPVGLGLEVSQMLSTQVGVDGIVSYEDFQYGHNGVGVDALVRYSPFVGVHALAIGIGGSFLAAREYGAIGFAQGEISYEYRRAHAFSFLIGAGPQVALNKSGRANCPETGFLACFLWKDQYATGDVGAHLRLAIGTAF